MRTTKSKKILSAILAICLVFGSAAALPRNAFSDQTTILASAENEPQQSEQQPGDDEHEDPPEMVTEEGIRYIVQDGKVTVTGCEGEQPNLVIPATIDGKKVTAIAQGAFAGKEHMRHVLLPDSIKEIGMDAFAECSSVEEVNIPKSCKNIDNRAFFNCSSLKAIDLKNVEHLGFEAFKCTGIESVTVPDSAKVIDDCVFQECHDLKTAVLGKGTDSVAGAMFMFCENLTKVTIPDNYKFIISGAFIGCEKLESVDLPNSLTFIGDTAFASCGIKSLKLPKATISLGNWAFMDTKLGVKDINLENITDMGREVFLNTPWLEEMKSKNELVIVNDILVDSSGFKGTTLTVPKNIKSIAGQGISHVENLEKVIIPEGVEFIGDNAFDSDFGLKEIVIPASVIDIGGNIVFGCPSLTTYTVDAKNKNYSTVDGILFTKDIKTLVSCPAGKKTFTNKGEYTCPDSVTTIGDGAFNACSGLKKIDLPSGLETIGKMAFCSGSLTELTLPDSLKEIGDNAFNNQSKLTSVTIPASVKAIENNTFSSCPKLAEVIFAEGIEEIREDAFANCKALQSVIIPKSVQYIGWNAFGVTYKQNTSGEGPNENVNDNFIIYAYADDCDAHRYAHDRGVKFIRIADNARMAGANRYTTATAISQKCFEKSNMVYLASGLDFPDALAGVPIAAMTNAPILLSGKDKISDETLAEIKRLNAAGVVILGGTGVISDKVEKTLKENGVKDINRLFGKNRYETAANIATAMKMLTNKDPENLFFAVSDKYADSVSISSAAGATGSPILFVNKKTGLDDATKKYIDSVKKGVKNVYIIGGEGAISKEIQSAIDKYTGKKSTRLGGKTRYETNLAIIKEFAGGTKVLNNSAVGLATGMDYPDALTGGVVGAIHKAPMLLVNPKTGLSEDQKKAITDQKPPQRNDFTVVTFGGTGAVNEKIVREACMLVQFEDNHGGETKFEDSYCYKFLQKIDNEPFEMDAEMKSIIMNVSFQMRKNKDASYIKTTSANGTEETYTVGGKTYVLDAEKKTYRIDPDASGPQSIIANMTAEGNSYEVVNTNEDSGMIIEHIRITEKGEDDPMISEYIFKFSKQGDLLFIEDSYGGNIMSLKVNKFETGPQEIKLPDLTGWTEEKDDE